MNKRIEDALNNITIIVQQARMTAQEHAQLAGDLKLIKEELTKKEDKKKENTEPWNGTLIERKTEGFLT